MPMPKLWPMSGTQLNMVFPTDALYCHLNQMPEIIPFTLQLNLCPIRLIPGAMSDKRHTTSAKPYREACWVSLLTPVEVMGTGRSFDHPFLQEGAASATALILDALNGSSGPWTKIQQLKNIDQ